MKKYYIAVILSFFCIGVSGAFAQNIGFAVDQTVVAFDVSPNEQTEFILKVKNTSNEKQHVFVDVVDYEISDNNDITFIDSENRENGIKDLISPDKKEIDISPNSVEIVKFFVKANDNTSVGSHRGVVLFRAKNTSDENKQVTVQGQIGVHVLINVKGDIYSSGKINSFILPFVTFGDTVYKVEFENTGNIHYVPHGEMILTNIITKARHNYKFNQHFVFPHKKFNFVLQKNIPSLFGLYEAKVVFVDGDGAVHTDKSYILGFLFPVLIILLIGILFYITRKTMLYRRLNKKQVNKSD